MRNFSDIFSDTYLTEETITDKNLVKLLQSGRYSDNGMFGYLVSKLKNPYKTLATKWKEGNKGRLKRDAVEGLRRSVKRVIDNIGKSNSEKIFASSNPRKAVQKFNDAKAEIYRYFGIDATDTEDFFKVPPSTQTKSEEPQSEPIQSEEETPKADTIDDESALQALQQAGDLPSESEGQSSKESKPISKPLFRHMSSEEAAAENAKVKKPSKEELVAAFGDESHTFGQALKQADDRSTLSKEELDRLNAAADAALDDSSQPSEGKPDSEAGENLRDIAAVENDAPVVTSTGKTVTPPAPSPETAEVKSEEEIKQKEAELAQKKAADLKAAEELNREADPEDYNIFVNDITKYNSIARRLDVGIREFTEEYFEKTIPGLRVKIGNLLYPKIFPSDSAFTHSVDTDAQIRTRSKFGAGSHSVTAANKWNTFEMKEYMKKLRDSISKDTAAKAFASGEVGFLGKLKQLISPEKDFVRNYNVDVPGNIEKEIINWLTGYPISDLGVKRTAQETTEQNLYGPGINARIYQFILEGVMEVVEKLMPDEEPLKENVDMSFKDYLYMKEIFGFGKKKPATGEDYSKQEKQLPKDIKAKADAFKTAIKWVEVDLMNDVIKTFEPFIKRLMDDATKTYTAILANKEKLKNPTEKIGTFYDDVQGALDALQDNIVSEWGNALKMAAKIQNVHPQQNKERAAVRQQMFTMPDGRDARKVLGFTDPNKNTATKIGS